jgi:hypothetical protein
MATLAQIANTVRSLAVAKAPIKTGNLKRALNAYNRPAGMIKEKKGKNSIEIELSIDVAPPGAEYGQWWNEPTLADNVKKGKTKNIPGSINYGNKALNDPIVDKLLDDYINSYLQVLADDTVKQLEKELKKI